MMKIDLTGQKFGRLTVIEEDFSQNSKRRYWKCQCECGNEKIIRQDALTGGITKSCGCLMKEKASQIGKETFKDITGQKFGRLTVIDRSPIYKNEQICWNCICECGNKITVRGGDLRSGHTQSCGCLNKEALENYNKKPRKKGARIDLTGQRFGYLTVIKENPIRKNNKVCWDCQCDCGNMVTVLGILLRNGSTKSCGCLKRELTSCNRTNNITGQKFGHLTVLERDDTNKIGGKVHWKCYCDCGNIITVSGDNLRSGNTISCGCLTTSKGENKIIQLLQKNNINFIQQKNFKTCKFPNTNNLAKFDFYISDKNYLIEFDGKQHFEERGTWAEKEGLDIIRQRDQFKNNWCKENNIPLIRIPYTHEKDLCIEDLLLETSNFIYKGEQYYEK